MKKNLVSVVIRTKNENFWIGKCLKAIENQLYKNFEIIVVDNNSTDTTLKIIKKFFPKVKIVKYKSKYFLPGKSLNLGISRAKGDYIAMISGHCIPKNNKWLSNFMKNIKIKNIAGCYGKQEPLDISNPADIRDMYYLFGKDKKIQKRDPFFHNANSIIKKNVWKKFKFDEKTHHIEDRIWAQKVLEKNYRIIYEPKESVYHYHGVGHSHNSLRVKRISNIITKRSEIKKRKICAVSVIKNPVIKKNKEYLISEALEDLKKLKKIHKIILITNDKKIRKAFKSKKIIFLNRPESLSEEIFGPDQILRKIFPKIYDKYKSTHILSFEEIYPNRPNNFFKKLIDNYDDKYDCLVPLAKYKDHNIWKKDDTSIEVVFKSNLPKTLLKHSVFRELKGLGCIVRGSNIEANGRESKNTKFFEVKDKFAFKYDPDLIKVINKFQ